MPVLFIFFILLIVLGTENKITKKDYDVLFTLNDTNNLNGIFVFIVFISHFLSYNINRSSLDFYLLKKTTLFLGQLMVVSFFFFSGYGIKHSIDNKDNYFPKKFISKFKKLFKLYFIAILFYMLYNMITNKHYDTDVVLLSFIALESIGNSNWFVFVTFVHYIIILLLYTNFEHTNERLRLYLYLAMLIVFSVIIYNFNHNKFWIDTIVAFPFGMYVKSNEQKIIRFLNTKKYYFITTFIIIFLFLFIRLALNYSIILHNVNTLIFSGLLIVFNCKFSIRSNILIFFSNYTFEIYIYQRIFFDLVINILGISSFYLSFSLSLLFTSLWSIVVKKIFN